MEEQEKIAEGGLVLINGVLTLLACLSIYDKGYRVPKLLLTKLGSNLCFSLTLPKAISDSTAIKHCVQRLWLQIEVVMSVQ